MLRTAERSQAVAAFGCCDVEPEDAPEQGEEQHKAGSAAQVAAGVGAERGESNRDGDETHDWPNSSRERSRSIASRLAGGASAVILAVLMPLPPGPREEGQNEDEDPPTAIHHVEL